MPITLNTNVSSLVAQNNLNQTQNRLSSTLNRLSSGQRINDAKDDAAGLAIAQETTARIRGLEQGSRNGNDGIALIQTAESGMNETIGLLQRMRELAIQASTGTYQSSDLANLNLEYQDLMTEVTRVNLTSNFNGINLLQGGSVSIQIGSENTVNDKITIGLTATDTATLTITGGDILTNADAGTAVGALDTALSAVTSGMATLGAAHSNIESAVDGNNDTAIRLQAARSQIMDTDYAAESANLAKYQILQQSGAAMLTQANASGQIVMQLLQG